MFLNILLFIIIIVLIGWVLILRFGYQGRMFVTDGDDGKTLFQLELNSDPYDLVDRKFISFKVVKVDEFAD
jgi:hypothetical protein